jgi:hypothetical protein
MHVFNSCVFIFAKESMPDKLGERSIRVTR